MTISKFLKDNDEATQRAQVAEWMKTHDLADVARRHFPGKPTNATSVEEALNEAGANFTVGKFPMMAVLDSDHAVPAPKVVGICRTDTGEVLGTATPSYSVVQLADVFAPAQVLAERGEISLNQVQVVDAKVRLSGLVGISAIERPLGALSRPDVLAHFATFEADFSGKARNFAQLHTLRLWCSNGATTQDASGRVAIKHVGNATGKTHQAYAQLLNITEAAQAEAALFQRMAQEPMTPSAFRGFAARLLEEAKGKAEEREAQEKREREVCELERLFVRGQGNTGSSLWDGYNAVTDWIDHQRARKGSRRSAAALFESANYGGGERVKRTARAMLTRW